MTARSIAAITLTSTLAMALVMAAAGPIQAAEPTSAQRCASVGEVAAESFDRIAQFLPDCEADPRIDNTACATVVAMAGLVDQAGLMPMVIACAASGNTLGAHTARLSALLTDVGGRLTALSTSIQE